MDATLKILIKPETIQNRIQEISRQIESDYFQKDLVIVMILKGSICLVADLIRCIHLPLRIEAIQCSSYGLSGVHRGDLNIYGLDRLQIKGSDVLIVDDILDSGHTMAGVYKALHELMPRSLKSCVLLLKNVSRVVEVFPDYALFEIENKFVVGYGLDYKESYRGLPGIYVIE